MHPLLPPSFKVSALETKSSRKLLNNSHSQADNGLIAPSWKLLPVLRIHESTSSFYKTVLMHDARQPLLAELELTSAGFQALPRNSLVSLPLSYSLSLHFLSIDRLCSPAQLMLSTKSEAHSSWVKVVRVSLPWVTTKKKTTILVCALVGGGCASDQCDQGLILPLQQSGQPEFGYFALAKHLLLHIFMYLGIVPTSFSTVASFVCPLYSGIYFYDHIIFVL